MNVKAIIALLVAASLLQACSTTRAFMYLGPNITDHRIFHHDEIKSGDSIFQFKRGEDKTLVNYTVEATKRSKPDTLDLTLNDYLKTTSTTAFLVIRNDSILFESYYKGYTRSSISKVFSVSKSITSLLTGIAVDEGYIQSVHDPVTKYIPELKKKDPKFERLTIEHLLDMRAGFKFNEDSYFPTSKATRIYYGTNLLGKVKRAKFEHEPGEVYEYQSLATALLGLVVEKATDRSLSEYLQEKVWLPLGMENDATWDIDDKRHHANKAHAGVNTTAIDLAKIGRLYVNKGNWNGRQLVSASWVSRSTTSNTSNDYGYSYQWYNYGYYIPNPEKNHIHPKFKLSCFVDSLSAIAYASEKYPAWKFVSANPLRNDRNYWSLSLYPSQNGQFAAIGIMQQIIFVDPKKNLIVVRLGKHGDVDATFIRSLVEHL